ncbi:hypothetical protein WR25_18800 isoform B [Diploscapter pachys]|uniref:SPX domain-containing protein n=1 Tax=Diploscapter pachys TaxID=2018661 RepID=A0A2A2J8U0_9BILA|nr:hypothetical protein WR25_18800 isoform B [Diploscapter pachys]
MPGKQVKFKNKWKILASKPASLSVPSEIARQTTSPESEVLNGDQQTGVRKRSRFGLGIVVTLTGVGIGITVATVPFVTPALRRVCIPYIPATDNQLANVRRALRASSARAPLVDLGSGDGRVMRFGEQLASHLTPEWRKQYINYEMLKDMLYKAMTEIPTEEAERNAHISKLDEAFFNDCERELTKINLFFSQKIAEAQGKYHELQTELRNYKEMLEKREERTNQSTLFRRFGGGGNDDDRANKEATKTDQQLKLAFSEFYLSLVLVQNYQQLNSTGFRKILKKHDKLTGNEKGLDWRINKVEKSSFFLNRDIESLITNVEQSVINDLEGGNRQAGMKRLKVPPLSEKEKPIITFSLGLFMGASIILALAIVLSWWGLPVRPNEPKWVAVRLFRGPLLLFLSIFLCGLNMAGWAKAGVNHVLIFEVDPRNHLSYQTLMQIASFMILLWSAAVLCYLYAHLLHIPPFACPLALIILCCILLFNPLGKPDYLFYRNSRYWLIKHCYMCFTAPMHFVTFTDFWLGDQMNSLTTAFLDFQYLICFYATEVDYSNKWLEVKTINSTSGSVPWGHVDISTGQDMCMNASGVRSLVSIIPATVRFMQCLRRYRDTKRIHPHLVNAGKYATTYLVVACGALNKWAEKKDPNATSTYFYIWITAYIISFTYTFLWDIFMDWGLIDPRAPKDAPLLREEMIYGSKFYYYLAIVQDFILRLSWVLNVSLGEAWTLDSDFLVTLTAPFEVFRRFIWNYFRLENEHVNNCGQFRAVRDISIKPIRLIFLFYLFFFISILNSLFQNLPFHQFTVFISTYQMFYFIFGYFQKR